MVLLCVRPLYVDYSRVTDCPGLHTRPKLARWWGQERGGSRGLDRGTGHLGREIERREDMAGQRETPLRPRDGARDEGAEGWKEGQAT